MHQINIFIAQANQYCIIYNINIINNAKTKINLCFSLLIILLRVIFLHVYIFSHYSVFSGHEWQAMMYESDVQYVAYDKCHRTTDSEKSQNINWVKI